MCFIMNVDFSTPNLVMKGHNYNCSVLLQVDVVMGHFISPPTSLQHPGAIYRRGLTKTARSWLESNQPPRLRPRGNANPRFSVISST